MHVIIVLVALFQYVHVIMFSDPSESIYEKGKREDGNNVNRGSNGIR